MPQGVEGGAVDRPSEREPGPFRRELQAAAQTSANEPPDFAELEESI